MENEIKKQGFEYVNNSIHGLDKFTYYLVSMSTAALALSIQFSAKTGQTWSAILFLSWIFYSISAAFGLWQILKINEFRAYLGRFCITQTTENQRILDAAETEKSISRNFLGQAATLLFALILNGIYVAINHLKGSLFWG